MQHWKALALFTGLLAGCAAPAVPTEPAAAPAQIPSSTPATAPAQPTLEPTIEPIAALSMALRSPAFEAGGPIPAEYSCDGEDTSPELVWENLPQGAVSLALIVDDPDADGWVHWVVYDLPATSDGLPAGLRAELPAGGEMGTNTWGNPEYGGPCPPGGAHSYVFTLYALDAPLELPPGATAEAVKEAARGHILGKAELAATYERG
jgi:Raf kinase inhibitor-like YbhB/YbcL family protein